LSQDRDTQQQENDKESSIAAEFARDREWFFPQMQHVSTVWYLSASRLPDPSIEWEAPERRGLGVRDWVDEEARLRSLRRARLNNWQNFRAGLRVCGDS